MIASTALLSGSAVALQKASIREYQDEHSLTHVLRELTQPLGWGDQESGAFTSIIPKGSRVIVKPNFVLHENQGPWSFDAVITHPALVRVVTQELLGTGAREVSVGDAPVQGCDFEVLLQRTGLGEWSARLGAEESRFRGIHDFRRTKSVFHSNVRVAREDAKDLAGYVLFDLKEESLLEPVSTSEPLFRVTCYDPAFLARTHAPGRHQYLIARALLDSDVVVNLPKLKMHQKAGVTNALKNLVGINGNKEFLPHHRVGGSSDAGDCYPGTSRIKRAAERLYDFKNSSSSVMRSRMVNGALKPLNALLKIGGDETGVEGAWSGNDTVWRMTLDLNRILIYGKPDGTMSETPQRMLLHVSDGIIAGQGRGPLAPEPFDLGLLSAGVNAAAMDWVGALLLNLNPSRIPLLSGVFRQYRWPLATFSPADVAVLVGGHRRAVDGILPSLRLNTPSSVPPGWRSAVRGAAINADAERVGASKS